METLHSLNPPPKQESDEDAIESGDSSDDDLDDKDAETAKQLAAALKEDLDSEDDEMDDVGEVSSIDYEEADDNDFIKSTKKGGAFKDSSEGDDDDRGFSSGFTNILYIGMASGGSGSAARTSGNPAIVSMHRPIVENAARMCYFKSCNCICRNGFSRTGSTH
eukprot:SAG11_NODE_6502_length_1301_cov_1.219634_1_plen_162_part_10